MLGRCRRALAPLLILVSSLAVYQNIWNAPVSYPRAYFHEWDVSMGGTNNISSALGLAVSGESSLLSDPSVDKNTTITTTTTTTTAANFLMSDASSVGDDSAALPQNNSNGWDPAVQNVAIVSNQTGAHDDVADGGSSPARVAISTRQYDPLSYPNTSTSAGDIISYGSKIPDMLDGTTHGKKISLLRNISLIYVHVGKTGGTTLDSVLRSNCVWYHNPNVRKKCLQKLDNGDHDNQESMISQLTKASTHTGPRQDFKAWISKTDGFLVTVRNPVSRVVSAFNMEHPRNTVKKKDGDTTISLLESVHHTFRTFYLECFPTVEHLAQRLLLLGNKRNHRNTTDQECFDRGSKTLRGQGHPFVASHLKMNYGFYAKDTFGAYPERPVLVAWTEHLWDDLKRIDLSLGGNGVFSSAGLAVTHGSEKRAVRDGLSQMGKEIICCYISNELSIYENLVRRATNLSPSEKEELWAKSTKTAV